MQAARSQKGQEEAIEAFVSIELLHSVQHFLVKVAFVRSLSHAMCFLHNEVSSALFQDPQLEMLKNLPSQASPGMDWEDQVGRRFQGLCDGGMGTCRCLNCDVSESFRKVMEIAVLD